MGVDSVHKALAAAEWAGCSLSDHKGKQLIRLHDLLRDEAIPAGGLGPNEADRIWSRHIGDSLLLGRGLERAATCVDIGAGVGLPGLPLAVAYPDIAFELVDRSGRRCDLIRRAIAVLRLGNCAVVHSDVTDVDNVYDAVVSRAAFPINQLMIHVKRLLRPTGVAMIALSRTNGEQESTPLEWPDLEITRVDVPADILDTPVTLLRIEAT